MKGDSTPMTRLTYKFPLLLGSSENKDEKNVHIIYYLRENTFTCNKIETLICLVRDFASSDLQ